MSPGDAAGGGAGSASPTLEAQGLTRRFDVAAAPAVDRVDLEVADREVLAVVGASGCGKTTLLRLVAGLEVPDEGTVRIEGRTVTAADRWVPPEKRDVGMVFQDFALFPHLRVLENVTFGLRSPSRPAARRRGEHMLERVGLGGLGERYPHQISGGQRQRVALARALAPEPRLLLLDEPFSNLDVPLKAALRDEVADLLRRTRVATLLVVHEADDVFALADRVLVMRRGRIVQSGRPAGIYAAPRDEYVARLFGEANILPARPSGAGLETPLGTVPAPDAPGRRSRLLARPEDLEIGPDSGAGLCAVVEDVRRQGVHWKVRLRSDDPERDRDGEPRFRMTALADAGGVRPCPGDRVHVRLRKGAGRVLVEEEGATGKRP